jgi:hypothetical protein
MFAVQYFQFHIHIITDFLHVNGQLRTFFFKPAIEDIFVEQEGNSEDIRRRNRCGVQPQTVTMSAQLVIMISTHTIAKPSAVFTPTIAHCRPYCSITVTDIILPLWTN